MIHTRLLLALFVVLVLLHLSLNSCSITVKDDLILYQDIEQQQEIKDNNN